MGITEKSGWKVLLKTDKAWNRKRMELMRRPLPMKHKTTEKSGWKVLLKTDKAWNRKRMEWMRRWLPMKHKSTEKSGRKLLLKTDRTRNRKRMEWTRHHLFMKTELAMRPDLRPPPPWIVAAVRCAMRRATLATRSLRSTLLRMPGSTGRTPHCRRRWATVSRARL